LQSATTSFKFSNDSLEAAKVFAVVLMAINHVLLSYPNWNVVGYIIGRPCIPIFAYIMVERLASGDADRSKRILVRLLMWGVVSQLPYQLLFGEFSFQLNIFFMLAFGAALIHLIQIKFYMIMALAFIAIIYFSRRIDGSALIPISILIGYWLFQQSRAAAVIIVVLAAAMINLNSPLHWQAVPTVLLSLPLIFFSPWFSSITPRAPTSYFYVFYPLHIILIWIFLGPIAGS
jgi:hypothetical protein